MRHPYVGKPDYQFWKKAGGLERPRSLDPVTGVSFRITKTDAVVTAGSCFAQHVSRYLGDNGFQPLVTEKAHAMFPRRLREKFNYGTFSARYGNIYTARQLRQLLERAYGLFDPIETSWQGADGRVVDPFRPQIQPDGFISATELNLDRTQHLAAVRQAIEDLTVFVFTLGLTEAWIDTRDGAVYPLAPGVAGGTFDPELVGFHNFTVAETAEDLAWSLDFIRTKNPAAKFIITVSPVPLNATALDRHVLVSTVYSKAALRVAAEEVCNQFTLTDYFPSFDIITAPHVKGRYYAKDRRAVTEAGVSHVMSLFLKHYGGVSLKKAGRAKPPKRQEKTDAHIRQMEEVVEVLCDEEMIDNA